MMNQESSVLNGILRILGIYGPSTDWQLIFRLSKVGYSMSLVDLKSFIASGEGYDLIELVAPSPNEPLEKFHLTDKGWAFAGRNKPVDGLPAGRRTTQR